MAALEVSVRIIALVWRAIDTDAGADAIEALRGDRPGPGRPAQDLIVEGQAIRIAGALGLVDDADVGALTRAHTSVMNAVAEGFGEDPGATLRAGATLRQCTPAVRKLADTRARGA